jgi:hypothetical protein
MNSVLYSGYANSGGTIIGLIFEEMERAVVLPMEFRLLKERFGLCELEDALFKSMDPEIIDLALKDFQWLCKQYATSIGRFNRAGYSYEQRSGNTFGNATDQYINSLIDFKYAKSWHYYDFKLSYPKLLLQRAIKKLSKHSTYGQVPAYLAYPDRDIFIENTRNYLKEILNGFLHQQVQDQNLQKRQDSFIVLPKSIPLYSELAVKQIIRYFDDCRIILIDRDPRDVFLEVLNGKQRYLPGTNNLYEKAEGFIRYYQSVRADKDKVKAHPNVLLLQFEDVILDSEKSLLKIYEFLGISPHDHSQKGSIFKPKDSEKNIGLWKKVQGEEAEAIRLIESELGTYLYTG